MPHSRWSVATSALATVALLVGPALLASWLGWPLDEHTSWTWLVQYLRSGTLPSQAVIAALVVALWGLWAAHLVVLACDIIAALRGLTPRMGLVRMVWLLAAGGAVATSTNTAALATPTSTAAQVPAEADPSPAEADSGETEHTEPLRIDRNRTVPGFGFDSAALTTDKKEALEPTIELLDAFADPEAPVVVTGHTDPVGDSAYNQALSEERAQTVAEYLRQQLGEDVQIQVEGAGSTQPPAEDGAPYEVHRRVEITYSLYKPAEPPAAQAAEEAPPDNSAPPQEVDADPASTHEDQESGALTLAVTGTAGAVGAAAGYAVGRRRTSSSSGRWRKHAQEEIGSDNTPAEHHADSSAGAEEELTRRDPEGIARGAIDEDGYVLVADTLRINGRGGIAFTGRYAARALAALAADHTTGSTVATNAAAEAIEGSGQRLLPDIHKAADVYGVHIAVDAELLAAARRAEEEDEVPGPPPRPLLVLVKAGEVDAQEGLLATPPCAAVVCVLGTTPHTSGQVHCDDTGRVHLSSDHSEVGIAVSPRHWPVPTQEESPEPSPELPEPEAEPAAVVDTPAGEDENEAPADEAPLPSAGRVQVRLFAAEPLLTHGTQPVTGLRAAARILLSFLALHPEGGDGDQITEACFPDASPDKAAAYRRNAIHSLRSTLRPRLNSPDKEIVIKESGRYRIDKSLFEVDLWEFLRVAEEAKVTETEAVREPLSRIIELHKENLLHECEHLWIGPVRERCKRVVVNACVRLSESTEDKHQQIQYLETACSFDEFNEPLYQRLMSVHGESGLPEAAHQVYRSLKQKLKALGEKPSEESQRILNECVLPAQHQGRPGS